MREATKQMREKKGPYYESWRRGVAMHGIEVAKELQREREENNGQTE